jgi:hypothetical protein
VTDAAIGSNDGLAASGDAATGATDGATATTDAVATSLEGTATATSNALSSVYDAGASTDAATGAVSGLTDAGVSSADAAAAVATNATVAVSDAVAGGIESLANATSEANGVISAPEAAATAAPDLLTSFGDASAPGDAGAAVTNPVTNLADAAASSTGGAISATTTLADSAAGVSGDVASSPADVLPGAVDTAVSDASTASLAGATDTAPLADAATGVGTSAFDGTAPPDLVMPVGDATTAAADVTVDGTNAVTALAGVTDAATPQLAAMSGPVPSANGVGGGPDASGPLSGIAGDFLATAADAPRVDLLALTHALAAPEARLGLLTAIGLIGVSRAYGVGVIGTVQPLMEACTASIRMTFQSVRLVPCTAGATASGFGSVGNVGGTTDAERRSRPFGVLGERVARASHEQVARAAELPGQAVERLRPWAAHGSSLVVRVVIYILATLSTALAAVGAVRHGLNQPDTRRYS